MDYIYKPRVVHSLDKQNFSKSEIGKKKKQDEKKN